MSRVSKKVFLAHVRGFDQMVRVDGTEIRPPKGEETDRRVCLYHPVSDARMCWVPVTRLSDDARQRLGV